MTDQDDKARNHAHASVSLDTLAAAVDSMAARFDGEDLTTSSVALGDLLVDYDGAGRDTYARALAAIALRHRRALEAAATFTAPPAPRSTSTRSTVSVWAAALTGAAAFAGGLFGAAFAGGLWWLP